VKALLLAAGFGTRLRPLTDTIPKCLVPIRGKPLLQYWLELFSDSAISEILINTHYLPEQVNTFIQNNTWKNKIRLVHEDILLGTGGTVLQHEKYFSNGPFIVAHADNLTRFDVSAFISAHQKKPENVDITMMTFETDTPESCGIVETDHDNIVTAFYEKTKEDKGTRANGAVYIVEPNVLHFLKKLNKKIIDISTEVLPHYLGRMQVFHNDNYHRDIGTASSLALAEKEF
jgi:mannose-1-phosphate guanylyltransferase